MNNILNNKFIDISDDFYDLTKSIFPVGEVDYLSNKLLLCIIILFLQIKMLFLYCIFLK